MNILMMAYSRVVGLTYYLSRLLISLHKKNIKVAALTNGHEQERGITKEIEDEGVSHYVDSNLDCFDPIRIWKSAAYIRRILIEQDIDVVHVQGFSDLIRVLFALRYKDTTRKVKTVYTLNTFFPIYVCRFISKYADLTLVPSQQAKEFIIKAGASQLKTRVIHNWLNLGQFDKYMFAELKYSSAFAEAINDADGNFAYSANLLPHKDHASVIRALVGVRKQYPKIKLLLLGEGPLEQSLKKLSRKLNLQDNIIFLGRLPYRLVPGILNKVNAGIVSSTRETFCHSIVESLAARKPIITTPVGVAPEIMKYGVGIMIPKKDPLALSNAIVSVLDNPERTKEMGLEGRRVVERMFAIDRIVEKLEKAYDFVSTS